MQKVRVAVLRGGPSSEYEVSLKTGSAVLRNLDQNKYDARDVLITQGGSWHYRGLPVEPPQVFGGNDVVFNALHGEYGEDGRVQQLLTHYGIPYTGSPALESAVCMNKEQTKQGLRGTDILVPKHIVLEVSPNIEFNMQDAYNTFSPVCVVKPLSAGSSVGVGLARSYGEFTEAVRNAFSSSPYVIVEEYIEGREATCGVVDGIRGEEIYSLLPIEIIPDQDRSLFDYDAKYNGKSQEIVPGNFSKETSDELQRHARTIHEVLNLRHYSRSDFIVSPKGIYFLEVNTLPGLTAESLIPKSLQALGISLPSFLDHIVTLAMEKR